MKLTRSSPPMEKKSPKNPKMKTQCLRKKKPRMPYLTQMRPHPRMSKCEPLRKQRKTMTKPNLQRKHSNKRNLLQQKSLTMLMPTAVKIQQKQIMSNRHQRQPLHLQQQQKMKHPLQMRTMRIPSKMHKMTTLRATIVTTALKRKLKNLKQKRLAAMHPLYHQIRMRVLKRKIMRRNMLLNKIPHRHQLQLPLLQHHPLQQKRRLEQGKTTSQVAVTSNQQKMEMTLICPLLRRHWPSHHLLHLQLSSGRKLMVMMAQAAIIIAKKMLLTLLLQKSPAVVAVAIFQKIRVATVQPTEPEEIARTVLKGMRMTQRQQECKAQSESSLQMKFSVMRLKMGRARSRKTAVVVVVVTATNLLLPEKRKEAVVDTVKEVQPRQQQRLSVVAVADLAVGKVMREKERKTCRRKMMRMEGMPLLKMRTVELSSTKTKRKQFPALEMMRLSREPVLVLVVAGMVKAIAVMMMMPALPLLLLHPQSRSVVRVCLANSEENGTCDLNLEDPDLEKAATRIQAAFRGHNTRKQLGGKMAEGEEVIDIDLNDPEVGHAATKIQASFRGHKARREAEKKAKDTGELTEELQKLKTTEEKPAAEDDEELPDLNDPEVNKAATKIQAHFKGHLVRKTLKDPKDASN